MALLLFEQQEKYWNGGEEAASFEVWTKDG